MAERSIMLAAAMAVACSAHAEVPLPAIVGVHLVSLHAQDGKNAPGSHGWNNVNPGLYARWANGFTAGFYRNSLYRDSAYVGWTFTDRNDRFAITLGAVSGYDKVTTGPGDYRAVRCESTCREVNLKKVITPMVVPSVRLGLTDNTSARLSLVAGPRNPPAVHLSVERRF